MADPVNPEEAVRRATQAYQGAASRWARRAATGLTDGELRQVLDFELGELAESSGPGIMTVGGTRRGLKIWALPSGARVLIDRTTRPLFSGAATVAAVRRVYRIPYPGQVQQLELFSHG